MLEAEEILKVMPHRYPFVLVDRILEIQENKRCVGIKNVTINEPFFQGHYPGKPIMPGVLIAEAIAQVGGIMLMYFRKEVPTLPYLTGIDKLRFRKPVRPGDVLLIEVEMMGFKGNIGKMRGNATVNGQIVAQGEMMFALIPVKADQASETPCKSE